MHKQIFLPRDGTTMGFPMETLGAPALPQVEPIISVKTSFGRAVVANRIPAGDSVTWTEGLRHAANDHRYYELTHQSLGQQFEHYYLLLKDHAGTTRAIQPFLIVDQDLVTGTPGPIRRILNRIREKFPSTLVMRMLMVGCSAGEGHLVRDAQTGGDEWVAEALREALQPIARGLRAGMIVFKDFPQSYRKSLAALKQGGYTRVPSMPGSRLDLAFTDFEQYLNTKLSHKTRKNLRYKYRKAAAGPKIELQVVSDITPYIDEVYPLYRQVLQKSHYKFEELTEAYFLQLGQSMSDRTVFFIWRQNGRL
jgi:hypothetical protein